MDITQILSMDKTQARTYLEAIRWPKGPTCPHCKSRDAVKLQGTATREGVYKCRNCRDQFTVTVGTIFESSHIPLNKWIAAFHLMCSSKKGISAHQLHRSLGITYKSAWHLAHRVRLAMNEGVFGPKLSGQIEVDETYVGPKKKRGAQRGRSYAKACVMALVERHGRVRNRVIRRANAKELKGAIREMVTKNSTILTDDWKPYRGIGAEYAGGHHVVKHSRGEYVKGIASTNTAESYFATLKRGVNGTFHHVSRHHLHRYCDEFSFRWNNREINDFERMDLALKMAEGKRLTYVNRLKSKVEHQAKDIETEK